MSDVLENTRTNLNGKQLVDMYHSRSGSRKCGTTQVVSVLSQDGSFVL